LKPADSHFTNRSAALRESRHGENADLLVLISKAFYQSCSILYTAHGSLSDKDGSSAKQEVVRVLPLTCHLTRIDGTATMASCKPTYQE